MLFSTLRRRVCLAALLWAGTRAACCAQSPTPAPVPAPAPPATVPPVVPMPPLSAAPGRLDLTLLQKALSPLVNSRVADCESEMTLYAAKAGATITLREHLRVTARRPGRFASDVTLQGAPGDKPTRYLVVSDGLKVMTVRPGLRKYSVMPLAQFQAGDDDFPSLGLVVGLLYLGDTSFIKGLSSISKDNTGQSQAMLRKLGMAMTVKPTLVDGATTTLFTLLIGKVGAYKFYVNPQTQQMAQVELRTVQDGVTIRLVERLVSFNPLMTTPPGTFVLAPPPDAQKVKQLTVSFF